MTAALAWAKGRAANHVKRFFSLFPEPQPESVFSETSWHGNQRSMSLVTLKQLPWPRPRPSQNRNLPIARFSCGAQSPTSPFFTGVKTPDWRNRISSGSRHNGSWAVLALSRLCDYAYNRLGNGYFRFQRGFS